MALYSDTFIVDAKNEPGNVCTQLTEELKLILVDGHALVRLALQRVVDAFLEMETIARLGTIQEVFTHLATQEQHILVLGPSVPITDCISVVKMLREREVQAGVVVIQQNLLPETVRTLIEQGVHGVLDECASEQDLLKAIRAAARRTMFLSRSARTMLAIAMSRTAGHLTEREIQVLSRLKYGETNIRIATTLGLKEKTIEKYLTTIYDKLNVHSRAEAILCLQKLHF